MTDAQPGRREGQPISARRGFVLSAVLLALLLIAALVAGVLFAVTEESRITSASAERQRALSAAETAIEMTVATLPESWSETRAVGETGSAPATDLGVPVTVYTTRLDSTLWWIVAEAGGDSARSGVRRRIGALVGVSRGADGSFVIDRIAGRWWSELF